MAAPAQVPNWALEPKTFIGLSLACGAVIAIGLSAVAIDSSGTMGQWLTAFLSSLVLPILVVGVLLIAGLRRIVLGPARKQTVIPLKWWVLAYALTRLPLFGAFVLLALAAALAWALGWPQRASLAQALVFLVAVSVTFSLVVKTIGNGYLLIRHWRAQ